MIYKIDIKRISDGKIHIQGWALADKPKSDIKFCVLNDRNESVDFKLVRLKREDVAEVHLNNYDGEKNFGFDIEFDYKENDLSSYYLIIKAPEKNK